MKRFTRKPSGNGESDASIAFGCGRATPLISHSHKWPSLRMHLFFVCNYTKTLFFANKEPKIDFDACMTLQNLALSLTGNRFWEMAKLKVISSSATLRQLLLPEPLTHHCYKKNIFEINLVGRAPCTPPESALGNPILVLSPLFVAPMERVIGRRS